MSLKEFVKIAVGLREHPKVLKAGDEGGWLYVCAIMWSKEHDTDGFIPEHVVPRLTGLKSPMRIAQACAAAGLFEAVDGGWEIHDYLEVQESSERRKAAGRKAANVRWERERAKQSQSESHANRTANAVRDRNTEEEEEKEEEKPPHPPASGGRKRAVESFERTAAAWATSAGVSGDDVRLVKAYRQAAPWTDPEPAAYFRGFCRQHFPSLTIEEAPMPNVHPLPERAA